MDNNNNNDTFYGWIVCNAANKIYLHLKIRFFHFFRDEKLSIAFSLAREFLLRNEENETRARRVQKVAYRDICLRFAGLYLERRDL